MDILLRVLLAVVATTAGMSCAFAAEPEQEPMQVVSVNGIANPELRSYRHAVAGLDAFDKHHGLAPLAPEVRFRLSANLRNPRASAGNEELHIVGNETLIPVAFSTDGTFSLPRSEQAYDDNADLLFNRKKGQSRFKAEVRTPGLPDNVRRLGDVRLECQVSVAIIKEEIPLLARVAANTMLMTSDWCNKQKLMYRSEGSARLESASLIHADRRIKLRIENMAYFVPLSDSSWPDDALIELTAAP